jgi:hypothetical protein
VDEGEEKKVSGTRHTEARMGYRDVEAQFAFYIPIAQCASELRRYAVRE